MPIRAVVFDLFDTLVDLRHENLPMEEHHGARLPSSVRALHDAVRERAEVSFDDFTRTMVESARDFVASHFEQGRELPTLERFEDLVRRLGLSDPDLPARLTALHMDLLRSQVALLPHHEAVLASLGRELRLGLCSNFSHSETALGILEEGGLRSHLDSVVISDAFGLRKPRAEIFEAVLGELGVARDEVLHVGDSLRADVAGAAALGIRTAWITRRVREPEQKLAEHEGALPDHTLADLAELPALLADELR